jgi:hypothetical protein
MTSTETAIRRNVGGRPLGDEERRKRLHKSYVDAIGVNNLTPRLNELISSAVELTCLAAKARRFLNDVEMTPNRQLALVRLEGGAAAAVARLNAAAPRSAPARIDAISTIADDVDA